MRHLTESPSLRATFAEGQRSGRDSPVCCEPPYLSTPATVRLRLPAEPPDFSVSVTLYFFPLMSVVRASQTASPGWLTCTTGAFESASVLVTVSVSRPPRAGDLIDGAI